MGFIHYNQPWTPPTCCFSPCPGPPARRRTASLWRKRRYQRRSPRGLGWWGWGWNRGWDWCPNYWALVSHHQNKYLLEIGTFPIVGWCETLGHLPTPDGADHLGKCVMAWYGLGIHGAQWHFDFGNHFLVSEDCQIRHLLRSISFKWSKWFEMTLCPRSDHVLLAIAHHTSGLKLYSTWMSGWSDAPCRGWIWHPQTGWLPPKK